MRKNRTRVRLCFLGGVVALFGFGLALQLISSRLRANTSPTPYTVKLKHIVRDSRGMDIGLNATMTIAVRRDGARAIVNTQVHRSGEPEVTRNVEFPSGERFTVGDLWDIKTSWKRPPQDITQWYRDPSRRCEVTLAGTPLRSSGERVEGEELIGNIRAIKLTYNGNSEWLALEYGCALIGARFDFGNSVNEQVLVSVNPGDPDPALFHVPASFREVAPSGYSAVMRSRLNLPCDQTCLVGEMDYDQRYFSQEQNR